MSLEQCFILSSESFLSVGFWGYMTEWKYKHIGNFELGFLIQNCKEIDGGMVAGSFNSILHSQQLFRVHLNFGAWSSFDKIEPLFFGTFELLRNLRTMLELVISIISWRALTERDKAIYARWISCTKNYFLEEFCTLIISWFLIQLISFN